MDLVITIPSDLYPRVVDAFANSYRYEDGTETKDEFLKRLVAEYIQTVTKSSEIAVATETAHQTAIATTDQQLNFAPPDPSGN